ncbi:class I SAM-dependent methyltransferase [Caloranaerobacter ferrireducens]|uniref:class I SAM-dependent methyltransferase n=1 Tax=Caloranaerobacter ferrireducens TaxID=1323370 RepID=UPI00084CF0D6|nr:class I SAM-dependent methyltransferase [Caloranaerobacter ferrireducens]
MINKTIEYYDVNCREFFENTVNVDMTLHYNEFEKYLKKNSKILDIGCGSGRDSLYFMSRGYEVLAFDASDEMVKMSSSLIGTKVIKSTFEEFDTDEKFDGLWACSSLLHVRKKDMRSILKKYTSYLKENGVFYLSFKYGNKEYEKDGRYFNCYDELAFKDVVKDIDNLVIEKLYISRDARKGRENERWLNVILKKIS